ncbi:response regulator [Frischella sp. Ac48]|uniref:Response regulator n=1 Tax=Frischella japonica TaxID=2741544 RepID=A0ABR7QW20_9GAMM|nr:MULTISPECIES: response regulator [Frischella]MBC9130173.1 response regulator [Frischella japonica]MBX4133157.1 response regulator [Frischella sp. Ac48]
MNGNILIIEDDERLANLIVTYLSKHQYQVTWYARGDSAEAEIARLNPDIVILDVMLPGKSGFDICRDIQSWYEGYVLIMTASEDNLDEIIGLELGADDYLAKPVEPRLLLARVRALLRRRQADSGAMHKSPSETVAPKNILRYGQLLINLDRHFVSLNQKEINLTTAEFELLCLLVRNAGTILSRDDIYSQVRGIEFDGLDRSMDARISRLRRKLSNDDESNSQQFIKTIRGKGYLFSYEGETVV